MEVHPLKLLPGGNVDPLIIRSQIEHNLAKEYKWLCPQEKKERPLILVGGGPSLNQYWEIIEHLDGDVMALNNAYSFLLKKGIEPEYFALLDARAQNIDFIRETSAKTNHLLSCQCHPDIFERLTSQGLKTTLYLSSHKDIAEMTKFSNKTKVVVGGYVGTIGMKAITLGLTLGYTRFHLLGYDSSYKDGEHHAFEQKMNDNADIIEVRIEEHGKKYYTTKSMAHQASEFCDAVGGMLREMDTEVTLHCEGLLPDLVAYSNKVGETPLEIRERHKYIDIWEHDVYRKTAPGENYVNMAIDNLRMHSGDRVIDFGCGTGRGAHKMRLQGMDVVGIDFALNALEVDIAVIESCLWDSALARKCYQAMDGQAKWGYCTDVMEHIPPEKIDPVLKNIRQTCSHGAFFNIATGNDLLGGRIGRKLHVSVFPTIAWEHKLKEFWSDVEIYEDEGSSIFITRS